MCLRGEKQMGVASAEPGPLCTSCWCSIQSTKASQASHQLLRQSKRRHVFLHNSCLSDYWSYFATALTCEGTTEFETSHSLSTWHTAKLSLIDGNLTRLVLGAITKPNPRPAFDCCLTYRSEPEWTRSEDRAQRPPSPGQRQHLQAEEPAWGDYKVRTMGNRLG